MKKFLMSFVFALRGIADTVKTERNMRIHLCFVFYVTVCGIICRITPWQWVSVLVCMGTVTGLELINTAVEKLCDKLHPEKDELIGKVKDISAGAVLTAAVFAAIIGGIIFFNRNKVTVLFEFITTNITVSAIMILLLPVWIFFIVGRKKNDK